MPDSLCDALPHEARELGKIVNEAIPRDVWAMPQGSVDAGREALQRLVELAEENSDG